MDWVEIFRTGTHTDSLGHTREWTEEDLKKIAESYDPTHHEAPIVVGHPEQDAPAYGWVERLEAVGGRLKAKLRELNQDFVNLVRQGSFKKVSVAIYPDLTLRHVGFLGAQPPAVKGLKQAQFSDQPAMEVEMDFASQDQAKQAQEARAKHYGIAIKQGGNVTKPSEWASVPDEEFLDPVNYRYPCPDAKQTQAAAGYWGHPDNQAQYSSEEKAIINKRLDAREKHFKMGAHAHQEGGHMKQFREFLDGLKALVVGAEKDLTVTPPTEAEVRASMAAEFAEKQKEKDAETRRREDAVKAREEALKQQEANARKQGIAAFCEGLLKAGRLTPAMMKHGMGVQGFLESLSEIQTGFEFGEPDKDGKKKTQTPLEFAESFLACLPKAIEFKEIAGRDKEGPASSGSASDKMEALIQEKMKKDKALSYTSAFTEVQVENRELALEALQEILQEIRPKKD